MTPSKAQKILASVWAARTQDEIDNIWTTHLAKPHNDPAYAAGGVAQASQNEEQDSWTLGFLTSNWSKDWPNDGLTSDGLRLHNAWIPMAAVKNVAENSYTMASKWLSDKEKELREASQKLSLELDKIAPKTELRLGGKDRFETSQLIANQYGKLYGGVVMKLGGGVVSPMTEAYIANGYRLVDALVAGQLSHGPIMLVKGKEAKAEELSKFTVDVAKNLQCWTTHKNLSVYGIGGKAVVSDESLRAVVGVINGQSVCPAGKPAAGAPSGLKAYIGNVEVGTAGSTIEIQDASSEKVVVTLKRTDGAPAKQDETQLFWLTDHPGLAAVMTADNQVTITPTAAQTTPGTYKLRVVHKGKTTDLLIHVTNIVTASEFTVTETTATINANATDTGVTELNGVLSPVDATGWDDKQLKIEKVELDGKAFTDPSFKIIPGTNDGKFKIGLADDADLNGGTYKVTVKYAGTSNQKNTDTIDVTVVARPFTTPVVTGKTVSDNTAQLTGVHIATVENMPALVKQVAKAKGIAESAVASTDFKVTAETGTGTDAKGKVTIKGLDVTTGKITADIAAGTGSAGNVKVRVAVKAVGTKRTVSANGDSADISIPKAG